jgi:hypothetical protein
MLTQTLSAVIESTAERAAPIRKIHIVEVGLLHAAWV